MTEKASLHDVLRIAKRIEPLLSQAQSSHTSCPICHGTRWFTDESGAHSFFCPALGWTEGVQRVVGLADADFRGIWPFKPVHERQAKAWKALEVILKAATQEETPQGRFVYVYGPPGSGKTTLAWAFVRRVATTLPFSLVPSRVRYVEFLDLVGELHDALRDGHLQSTVRRYAHEYFVLVIDEFDEDKAVFSDFIRAQVFGLLNKRYNLTNRGYITIFVGNRDPKDWGDYLASRIYDRKRSLVIAFPDTDLRLGG